MTKRGFTLVELMIVIAIIGILAASLFPSMTGYIARARDTGRLSDIKSIEAALEAYKIDKEYLKTTFTYGGNNSGAWDFSSQPVGVPDFLKYIELEGYMKSIPKDPINNALCDMSWGNPGCPGYSYFYYCYPVGSPAYPVGGVVLGFRMEKPFATGATLRGGKMGGNDNSIYYSTRWNSIEGIIDCK